MNRERAKELLPIITAFANGEDIQSDRIGERGVWIDRDEFVGTGLHWRIKPSPREFWIDTVATACSHLEAFEQEPDRKDNWPYIKVREVLE